MGFKLDHARGFLQIIDGYLVLRQGSDPVAASATDGYLYVKSDGGDAELFFMDSNGAITQITKDGTLNADEITTHNTLDQSYDEGGAGAGAAVTVDAGPIILSASGAEALRVDGYVALSEITDPLGLPNRGSVYTREVAGITELFYADDAGVITQVTSDGYLNTFNSVEGVGMFQQVADPSSAPDKGFFYVKDAGGFAELHYMDDAGSITQITADGYLATANSLRRVGFFEQSTDPTASPGKGFIYAKDVDGYSELFYLNSAGQLRQLTSKSGTDVGETADVEPVDTGSRPPVRFGRGRLFCRRGTPIEMFWLDDYGNVTQVTNKGYVAAPFVFDDYGFDPPSAEGHGFMYAKDLGGSVELFWMGEAGVPLQITLDEFLIAAPLCLPSLPGPPVGAIGKTMIMSLTGTSGHAELHHLDGYDQLIQMTNDGYLNTPLLEMPNNPDTPVVSAKPDTGVLFAQVLDGYAELKYLDNYGFITPLTNKGAPTAGVSASTFLDFGAPGVVPGSVTDVIAVPGAVIGDPVVVGAPVAVPLDFILTAYVSAPDVVTVKWTQVSGVAADPDGSGGVYRVTVIKD